MTTGPSSGHSESWYWLQSSHPADRQPASAGGHRSAPRPMGGTEVLPTNKTVQTQDVPPRKRPSSMAQLTAAESPLR